MAFDSNGISLLLEMQMVIYQLTPTNNKISSKKKLETLVAAIKKCKQSYGVGFTLRNATVGKSDVTAEGMLFF